MACRQWPLGNGPATRVAGLPLPPQQRRRQRDGRAAPPRPARTAPARAHTASAAGAPAAAHRPAPPRTRAANSAMSANRSAGSTAIARPSAACTQAGRSGRSAGQIARPLLARHAGRVGIAVGKRAGERAKQRDAQGVDVGRHVAGLAGEHLRRHVGGGAGNRLGREILQPRQPHHAQIEQLQRQPPASSITLSGLMSRWMMPARCSAAAACASRIAMLRPSSRPDRRRCGPGGSPAAPRRTAA